MYLGQLDTSLAQVYQELNYVSVRLCIINSQYRRMYNYAAFQTLLRVQLGIKELASQQKNGEYTIGLSGKRAAFKILHAFFCCLIHCNSQLS